MIQRRAAQAMLQRATGWSKGVFQASKGIGLFGATAFCLALGGASVTLAEGEDDGVYFDPSTRMWSSRIVIDGQLKKLKDRDSREQAERDYEYVHSRVNGTKIAEKDVEARPEDKAPPGCVKTPEEEESRLMSIKIMNACHVDPSKMSREKKLEFLAAILSVAADVDVPVLWRLSRGLHDLTDEFFESRDDQVEMLKLAKEYAEKALKQSPDHLQAQTWLKLSSIRLLDTQAAILLTESKSYGVSPERKAEIAHERAELQAQSAKLRAQMKAAS